MKFDIKRVLVIANLAKPQAERITDDIRSYLGNQGIEVVAFGFRGKTRDPELDRFQSPSI